LIASSLRRRIGAVRRVMPSEARAAERKSSLSAECEPKSATATPRFKAFLPPDERADWY